MHAVCAGVKQVGGRCVPDVWQMMCGKWCVADDVWQMMCGRWCVANDVWQMMCGRWCVADDVWQMMCGRWCVADDVWQMMCGRWFVADDVWQMMCAEAGQMYSTCVAGALQMCGRYMCAAANVWQFWQRQSPHMMVEKLTNTRQRMTHDELGIQISWPSDPGEIPPLDISGHPDLRASENSFLASTIMYLSSFAADCGVPLLLKNIMRNWHELTASVMKKWFYAKKYRLFFGTYMVQNDGMLKKFASIFGGPMSPALDEVVHTSHAVVCLSRTPDKPIEKRG